MSDKSQLTEEERQVIERIEEYEGRELSEQEISLSLKQARAMGEL